MATISGLRELLRSQTGDIARLSKEQRFVNEVLESALFNGLQAHSRSDTWATLPPEQEQLVLCLAKARLCRDKAMEYIMDTRLTVGSSFARDKTVNGQALIQMADVFQEEYEFLKGKLETALDGDITFGVLTRTSRTLHLTTPTLAASPPPVPVIHAVQYFYDADARRGRLRISWGRMLDPMIAFVRVYLSQSPQWENGEVIRTIYDLGQPVVPPAMPLAAGAPQLPQTVYEQEHTVLPTGPWFLLLAAYNWNSLYSVSAPFGFTALNYREVRADGYSVEPSSPLTTTTTTTSTTSTTTTT